MREPLDLADLDERPDGRAKPRPKGRPWATAALLGLVAVGIASAFLLTGRKAKAGPDPTTVIKGGEDAQKLLAQRQAELTKAMETLNATLAQFKPGDLKAERKAIAEYRDVIKRLKAFADQLIKANGEAMKHFQLYKAALDDAPGKLRAAGAEFEKFAAAEPADSPFKETYLDMRTRVSGLADEYAARGKALEAAERELKAKVAFVESSRTMLDRMSAFLELLAAGTADAAEVEKHLAALNAYCQNFEAAIQQFKTLSDKITASPPKP